jgi:putative protease
VGEMLKAEMRSRNSIIVEEEDFIVPSAEKSPTTESEIREQLSRLNDTGFSLSELKIEADKDILLPKSRLNSLRRSGIEKLKWKILEEYKRSEKKNKQKIVYPDLNPLRNSGRIVIAGFTSPDELEGADGVTAAIYRPENYTEQGLSEFINKAEKSGIKKIYLALPRLIRQEDMPLLERLSVILNDKGMGIVADNYGAVQYARDKGLPYIAGIGLNVYNLGAMAMLNDADYIFASPELSEREAAPLLDAGAILFGYGRLTLMHLAHCPIRLAGESDCAHCDYKGEFTYSDGKAVFPAIRSKINNCTFTLYNSLPHNLSGTLGIKGKSVYIDLKGIMEIERKKIIDSFLKGVKYTGEKSTLGGYGR